jgi:hypothetical protein
VFRSTKKGARDNGKAQSGAVEKPNGIDGMLAGPCARAAAQLDYDFEVISWTPESAFTQGAEGNGPMATAAFVALKEPALA